MTQQKIQLDNQKYLLYLELPSIVVGNNIKEDEQSAKAFRCFAEELIERVNLMTDQPFSLTLREYHCSSESSYVEIMPLDEKGEVIFFPLPCTSIKLKQNYLAQNLQQDEDSYVGKLEIEVHMAIAENSDGESIPTANPLAFNIIDLAFIRYYEVIAQDFPEWKTEYIDAPETA